MRSRFKSYPYMITGLLLAVLALSCVFTGCSPNASGSEGSADIDKLFTVRKSKLIIGTLLRGMANAKETHKLFPDASYKNILTWIEEENKAVKKGDVVIKFETQDLIDDIEMKHLNLELKQKSLDIKREEMRILLSENQSSLRISSDAVQTAEEAFARYYKYDGKNAKKKMMEDVVTHDDAHKGAKETYQNSLDTISNTIYDDEGSRQKAMDALDKLEVTMQTKERTYDNAVYALKIFKKYTYPNSLTAKENKLIQAKLNREKTLVSTASRVIQKENEINRIENELRKGKSEIEKVEGYLPMMEIQAPVDGILVYGDLGGRRGRNIEIELGMSVSRKRVMATIPEMGNLVIKFDLPEQFRHRIDIGSEAFITPDSMPSLKLTGQVTKIAVVPVNQIEWDSSSPKIYHSIITLDSQNEDFVSGMNVQVEVIEDTLDDALNIPVEAVFEEDGEYYVYLKTLTKTKKQIVELGKSNDQYVHILDGLSVGEQVYLYSPYELDSME
jgi:HlyD family secretion protein